MNVMSQPLTIRKVTRQLIQTVIVLFLTSLLILNLNYKLIQSVPPTTASSRNNDINSFKLEHCNCFRTLEIRDSNEVIIDSSILYNETTCGWDAYHRGSHQKVAGFSFYGDVNTNTHKSKQYFEGIKENLELLTQLYDDSWTMRLYFDLDPADPQLTRLCDLACSNNHLDLCHVGSLPGTPVKDARKIFAMNWRFFPTLDPQVDIYMCRDLDSRFSQREVEAVKEWLEADKPLHSMRDHPAHNTPLLGASWGARLDQPHGNIRHKWTRSWEKILRDKLTYAGRQEKGPDQTILQKYIWPWGKFMAMQHDSYTCHIYPKTIGFPTQRKNEPNNFVASVTSNNASLWKKCPSKCRRKGHKDWEYC